MQNTFGKEDLKRTIRIHHIFDVRDAYGHLASVTFSDRKELGGSFETPANPQTNSETQTYADRLQIDDATRRVRTLIVLEAALPPQALVASADRRARLVDSAAHAGALMRTIIAGALAEFVDAQHRAAKRAGTARPQCRATFARGCFGATS